MESHLPSTSTITISDTQYAAVSGTFTNSTTSALVSQGSTEGVNLFFIEDYSELVRYIGQCSRNSGFNGNCKFLERSADQSQCSCSGSTLDAQLLGETAAHEMGHQLGLFHTTESGGTEFDILTDTAECKKHQG